MTEIVIYVVAIRIFYKQMLVALGHWMCLTNMGNDVKTFGYLTGLINQKKPIFIPFWPFCRDTVQISTFGIKLTTQSIWRDDNLSLSITFNKILQSSCMVAVAVRDEHIIYRTEFDAHLLGITDKDITCSCVQQHAMLVRL